MVAAGQYDAFISYGHAGDRELAEALQLGLQRFARPWYRLRALRVFRDDANLSVNAALWTSIQAAIDQSRYLVCLASATSGSSPWVNREVSHWVETRGSVGLLLVLTDGECVWDPVRAQLDPERSTAIPAALHTAFAEEPRHLDLRWARGERHLSLRNSRFRSAVADLAAPIHGIGKEDLEGVDVRLHRRAIRMAKGAVAVPTMATSHCGTPRPIAGSECSRRPTVRRPRSWPWPSASTAERWRPGARTATCRSGMSAGARGWPFWVGTTAPVTSLAFAPGGRRLASGSLGDGIILWDLASRQAVGDPLTSPDTPVWGLTFTPNGHTLVTDGGPGGAVAFWDIRGRPRRLASGGGASFTSVSVLGVAASPDGRLIASADTGGNVVLWDARTARRVDELVTGRSVVLQNVAFSPDSALLVAGGQNGDVLLWDVASRRQIGPPLRVHTDAVTSLAFTPDGSELVTAGRAEAVEWDFRFSSWRAAACELAHRNLSPAEWARFLGGSRYSRTCAAYPAGAGESKSAPAARWPS